MDLDFDLFYCWDEFLKCSARVYTFIVSKIHPNTEIKDQNPSPSKVVTFLYIGTCLCYLHTSYIQKSPLYEDIFQVQGKPCLSKKDKLGAVKACIIPLLLAL